MAGVFALLFVAPQVWSATVDAWHGQASEFNLNQMIERHEGPRASILAEIAANLQVTPVCTVHPNPDVSLIGYRVEVKSHRDAIRKSEPVEFPPFWFSVDSLGTPGDFDFTEGTTKKARKTLKMIAHMLSTQHKTSESNPIQIDGENKLYNAKYSFLELPNKRVVIEDKTYDDTIHRADVKGVGMKSSHSGQTNATVHNGILHSVSTEDTTTLHGVLMEHGSDAEDLVLKAKSLLQLQAFTTAQRKELDIGFCADLEEHHPLPHHKSRSKSLHKGKRGKLRAGTMCVGEICTRSKTKHKFLKYAANHRLITVASPESTKKFTVRGLIADMADFFSFTTTLASSINSIVYLNVKLKVAIEQKMKMAGATKGGLKMLTYVEFITASIQTRYSDGISMDLRNLDDKMLEMLRKELAPLVVDGLHNFFRAVEDNEETLGMHVSSFTFYLDNFLREKFSPENVDKIHENFKSVLKPILDQLIVVKNLWDQMISIAEPYRQYDFTEEEDSQYEGESDEKESKNKRTLRKKRQAKKRAAREKREKMAGERAEEPITRAVAIVSLSDELRDRDSVFDFGNNIFKIMKEMVSTSKKIFEEVKRLSKIALAVSKNWAQLLDGLQLFNKKYRKTIGSPSFVQARFTAMAAARLTTKKTKSSDSLDDESPEPAPTATESPTTSPTTPNPTQSGEEDYKIDNQFNGLQLKTTASFDIDLQSFGSSGHALQLLWKPVLEIHPAPLFSDIRPVMKFFGMRADLSGDLKNILASVMEYLATDALKAFLTPERIQDTAVAHFLPFLAKGRGALLKWLIPNMDEAKGSSGETQTRNSGEVSTQNDIPNYIDSIGTIIESVISAIHKITEFHNEMRTALVDLNKRCEPKNNPVCKNFDATTKILLDLDDEIREMEFIGHYVMGYFYKSIAGCVTALGVPATSILNFANEVIDKLDNPQISYTRNTSIALVRGGVNKDMILANIQEIMKHVKTLEEEMNNFDLGPSTENAANVIEVLQSTALSGDAGSFANEKMMLKLALEKWTTAMRVVNGTKEVTLFFLEMVKETKIVSRRLAAGGLSEVFLTKWMENENVNYESGCEFFPSKDETEIFATSIGMCKKSCQDSPTCWGIVYASSESDNTKCKLQKNPFVCPSENGGDSGITAMKPQSMLAIFADAMVKISTKFSERGEIVGIMDQLPDLAESTHAPSARIKAILEKSGAWLLKTGGFAKNVDKVVSCIDMEAPNEYSILKRLKEVVELLGASPTLQSIQKAYDKVKDLGGTLMPIAQCLIDRTENVLKINITSAKANTLEGIEHLKDLLFPGDTAITSTEVRQVVGNIGQAIQKVAKFMSIVPDVMNAGITTFKVFSHIAEIWLSAGMTLQEKLKESIDLENADRMFDEMYESYERVRKALGKIDEKNNRISATILGTIGWVQKSIRIAQTILHAIYATFASSNESNKLHHRHLPRHKLHKRVGYSGFNISSSSHSHGALSISEYAAMDEASLRKEMTRSCAFGTHQPCHLGSRGHHHSLQKTKTHALASMKMEYEPASPRGLYCQGGESSYDGNLVLTHLSEMTIFSVGFTFTYFGVNILVSLNMYTNMLAGIQYGVCPFKQHTDADPKDYLTISPYVDASLNIKAGIITTLFGALTIALDLTLQIVGLRVPLTLDIRLETINKRNKLLGCIHTKPVIRGGSGRFTAKALGTRLSLEWSGLEHRVTGLCACSKNHMFSSCSPPLKFVGYDSQTLNSLHRPEPREYLCKSNPKFCPKCHYLTYKDDDDKHVVMGALRQLMIAGYPYGFRSSSSDDISWSKLWKEMKRAAGKSDYIHQAMICNEDVQIFSTRAKHQVQYSSEVLMVWNVDGVETNKAFGLISFICYRSCRATFRRITTLSDLPFYYKPYLLNLLQDKFQYKKQGRKKYLSLIYTPEMQNFYLHSPSPNIWEVKEQNLTLTIDAAPKLPGKEIMYHTGRCYECVIQEIDKKHAHGKNNFVCPFVHFRKDIGTRDITDVTEQKAIKDLMETGINSCEIDELLDDDTMEWNSKFRVIVCDESYNKRSKTVSGTLFVSPKRQEKKGTKMFTFELKKPNKKKHHRKGRHHARKPHHGHKGHKHSAQRALVVSGHKRNGNTSAIQKASIPEWMVNAFNTVFGRNSVTEKDDCKLTSVVPLKKAKYYQLVKERHSHLFSQIVATEKSHTECLIPPPSIPAANEREYNLQMIHSTGMDARPDSSHILRTTNLCYEVNIRSFSWNPKKIKVKSNGVSPSDINRQRLSMMRVTTDIDLDKKGNTKKEKDMLNRMNMVLHAAAKSISQSGEEDGKFIMCDETTVDDNYGDAIEYMFFMCFFPNDGEKYYRAECRKFFMEKAGYNIAFDMTNDVEYDSLLNTHLKHQTLEQRRSFRSEPSSYDEFAKMDWEEVRMMELGSESCKITHVKNGKEWAEVNNDPAELHRLLAIPLGKGGKREDQIVEIMGSTEDSNGELTKPCLRGENDKPNNPVGTLYWRPNNVARKYFYMASREYMRSIRPEGLPSCEAAPMGVAA
ncbi:hypothetical protein AAMO2058_000335200 [Amorphochlora amoebiformis]